MKKTTLRQLAFKGKEILTSRQKGGLLPKFFATGMKNKIPPLEIGKEIGEIFQGLLSGESEREIFCFWWGKNQVLGADFCSQE